MTTYERERMTSDMQRELDDMEYQRELRGLEKFFMLVFYYPTLFAIGLFIGEFIH